MTTPTTGDPRPAATGAGPLARLRWPTGERPARRPVNRVWAVVGWSSTLIVAGVLVLRQRSLGSPLPVAIVAVTPLFAAPLLVAVAAAWWSRSRLLRVAAAATTVGFLAATSPVDAVLGCRATSSGEVADDAITIYTANVQFDGGRPGSVAAAVAASGADVVVLQEVRWQFLVELRDDPRLAHLPHRSDASTAGEVGTIIWSRWPLSGVELERFEVSRLVHGTVAAPAGDLMVTGVHTLAPIEHQNVAVWDRQFDQLAAADTARPRVLAGDFNATADHRQFRDLLGSGWTDAHDPKGCGLDATWPVGRGTPVPVMRLDHVLVTDHFEVLDLRLGEPAGSDHLPVIAAIRLR